MPDRVLDTVLAFLREAVNDPNVLAIKQTIYRTGSDSALMDLLRQAVLRGKEVTAPARLPGVTENIRVRSIIGRFLEHSRVLSFRSGDDEEVYLSSPDWMNRNMLRRIELDWPVTDAKLRQRIIDECLVAYLHDSRDAWDLMPNGTYLRADRGGRRKGRSAQTALTARYGGNGTSRT